MNIQTIVFLSNNKNNKTIQYKINILEISCLNLMYDNIITNY